MKTLTEFSGFVLKEAMAKKAALITEGKTEEEAQAAINEQLKLDETKIPFYKNSVDMTSSRLDRVKRVVVALKATETEKVPEAFIEREGHFYLVEYFGSTSTVEAPAYDDRNSRGGGRGNDRGRGGGGRDGGGRGPGGDRGKPGGDRGKPSGDRGSFPAREPREPREARPAREQPAPNPNAASFVSTGLGTLAPRPAKPANTNRTPRPPRGNVPRGPKGAGELRLVLKGQSSTTLQGSGTNEPEQASAPVSTNETA